MRRSRLQLFTQVIYGYYTFPETCPYWLEASFCIPKLGIFTITEFCFPFVCIILCLLILHFICYFILESLTGKKSSWAPYRHFWFWLCRVILNYLKTSLPCYLSCFQTFRHILSSQCPNLGNSCESLMKAFWK